MSKDYDQVYKFRDMLCFVGVDVGVELEGRIVLERQSEIIINMVNSILLIC